MNGPTIQDMAMQGYRYILRDGDGNLAVIWRGDEEHVCAYHRKSEALRDMRKLLKSGEYEVLAVAVLEDGLHGKGYYPA